MSIPDVMTARLRLVAITPAMLNAESTDTQHLQPLLQAAVPAEWPDENWQPHVFDIIRTQFAENPDTRGWHRYIVLRGDSPVLIGAVGAFPRNQDEAECGYSILAPWQRNGFATEAAQALLEEVFRQPRIISVIAHTFPHLHESMRVMVKCGLTPNGAGDEEGTVRYRRNR